MGSCPVATLRDSTHTARRLFDEFQQAELAYRLEGTPHAAYLSTWRHRHLGETRREIERVAALGAEAGVFIDFFLREFGV